MARILVIDDDDDVRKMIRVILERDGHEVIEAPDGTMGMKLYREDPSDLVVTDIVMPGADGWETIALLKRQYSGVKILAVSGGDKIGPYSYLMMGKRLGADGVLPKPIKKETLLKTVRELLNT